MTTKTDQWDDLRRRFGPTKTAVAAAHAALMNHADADVAVVPLYMPGKSYAAWTTGQQVETVELSGDDVLVGADSRRPSGSIPAGEVPAVRDMIVRAFELASAALAEHGPGTTGYAIVRPDGTVTVFEEILSAT